MPSCGKYENFAFKNCSFKQMNFNALQFDIVKCPINVYSICLLSYIGIKLKQRKDKMTAKEYLFL